MTSLASTVWRPAEDADQAELSVFVCTHPEKPEKTLQTGWKKVHPRPWELDAQQMIRSLRVAARPPVETWVAMDAEGVAGVMSWTRLREPGYVHLDVSGVSMRHRIAKSGLGPWMMKQALGLIEAWAHESGALEMYVEGEIFNENKCSLRMVEEFSMAMVAEAPTGAQTWALRFPLIPSE